MTLRLATPLRLLALCAPILSTQAFASAMNEYTLSPSQMETTVTTFQGTTYQPQVAQPSYQTQPVQPMQPSYQTQPATTPQFGEIVYDTEPYMPGAGTTESYTIQPYSGDQTLQPMPQPTYQAPAYN